MFARFARRLEDLRPVGRNLLLAFAFAMLALLPAMLGKNM